MTSCAVYPDRYASQLADKAERLRDLFQPFQPPELELFASREAHYRMRAEFRVWHQDGDMFYAMFEPGDKRAPIRIDDCPMTAEPISDTMFVLLDHLKASPVLSRKLFQVDFLATLSGELLVTLLYHRALDEDWVKAARAVKEALGIDLIGRARKQKLVLDRDFVDECLNVRGRPYHYQQVENSFTQPNAGVNQQMLGWALAVTEGVGDDLLELYCGNGNFTIPLAGNFRRVLATEISKTSVRSAQENIARNQVDNIAIARLSSEEFTEAMSGTRVFRRLRDIDLASYAFSTVLVDPPRAGLDPDTEALVARYPHILYISCNPATLCQNLQQLSKTHEIRRFALFDQFPYTDHLECGVFLVRREGTSQD